MINLRIAKATLATALAIAIFAGCSLNSNKPDGSDLAAQSCANDLVAVSAASQIVDVGIDQRTPNEIGIQTLTERSEELKDRAILSVRAASINKYWQPLADAWALEEALIRASLASTVGYRDSEQKLTFPLDFKTFLSNVNIDFAAVAKDTYCRIAFVKQNIEIKYEN